jgi:hypothetical protein
MKRNIDEYVNHVVRDCMGESHTQYDLTPKNQAERHLQLGLQQALNELKAFLKDPSQTQSKEDLIHELSCQ